MIYFNNNCLCSATLYDDGNHLYEISRIQLFKNGTYETIWSKNKYVVLTYLDKDGNRIDDREFTLDQLDIDDGHTLSLKWLDESDIEHKVARLYPKISAILNGDLDNLIEIRDETQQITDIKYVGHSDSIANSGGFKNARNLEYVSFPSLSTFNTDTFSSCSNLKKCEISSINSITAGNHFAGSGKLGYLHIDSEKYMSIGDGVGNELKMIIDRKKYNDTKDDDIRIVDVKCLVPQITAINNDGITAFGANVLTPTDGNLTDLSVKNLCQLTSTMLDGTTALTNIYVDNDKLRSIYNSDGHRTIIASKDGTRFGSASRSITSTLSCDEITGFVLTDRANIKDLTKPEHVYFSKDVFNCHADGTVLTDKENSEIVYVVKNNTSVADTILTLSNTLTAIGPYSFSNFYVNIDKDVYLDFPNVTTVSNEAFYFTKIASINLPKCTELCGIGNFSNLRRSKYINLSSATNLPSQAFNGLRLFDNNSKMIFTNVKTIGPYAFSTMQCDNKDLKFNIDDAFPNVSSIGIYAFQSAIGLSSINLSSVSELYQGCMINCTSLLSAEFENAKYIGRSAFQSCSKLSSVYVNKCIAFDTDVFKGANAMEVLECKSMIAESMLQLTANIGISPNCYIHCSNGTIHNGSITYK